MKSCALRARGKSNTKRHSSFVIRVCMELPQGFLPVEKGRLKDLWKASRKGPAIFAKPERFHRGQLKAMSLSYQRIALNGSRTSLSKLMSVPLCVTSIRALH